MSPPSHSLPSDRLADLVSGMPSEAVLAIASAVEAGDVVVPYLALELRRLRGVTGEKSEQAAAVLSSMSTILDPAALALVLRTVDRLRTTERLGRPDIEIAWTGPRAEGPLVRPTRIVVEEMLRNVRGTGEILLVGYSVTAPEGSAMESVVGLLEDAARKRARITLVLHRNEGEARHAIEAMWSVFVKKPRVMTWDPSDAHPYTKMHAKALVVDRVEMLVGSANFTFLGLESNLELGLRVRGPHAAAVAERFDHLIAEGVITPWAP